MPTRDLPENVCPTNDALRTLWQRYPDDPDLHNVILELLRMRQVLEDVEAYREVIGSRWREANGDELVALEKLNTLVFDERSRLGRTSVEPSVDSADGHTDAGKSLSG